MNYCKIIDCWLIFETDVEGKPQFPNLRKVVFDLATANAQTRINNYIYIEPAKAINIPNGVYEPIKYVLRYEEEASKLGNVAKKQLRDEALRKLTEAEIAAINELGWK